MDLFITCSDRSAIDYDRHPSPTFISSPNVDSGSFLAQSRFDSNTILIKFSQKESEPADLLRSSSQRVEGLPLLLLPGGPFHWVTLVIHLLSGILATCPARCYFRFRAKVKAFVALVMPLIFRSRFDVDIKSMPSPCRDIKMPSKMHEQILLQQNDNINMKCHRKHQSQSLNTKQIMLHHFGSSTSTSECGTQTNIPTSETRHEPRRDDELLFFRIDGSSQGLVPRYDIV
ncbi:hypothetical protein EVAR_6888_1 [Eumeta japonica]|uniref:Uncharacterized protein n=1 Tax=Eumeta variegata TaxID=151549 RepID=A0A4C1TJB7_EUMVA|nr:hypothetical protein EVAR_6888_1 [Eumeta japonica]